MSKKSYRELAVKRCSNIHQQWRDHILKFPVLSDLARNKFWVMTTNAASERVLCMCWPGLSCEGRERAKMFNFQWKSSYDITAVCFHVYLSVFFTKYNIKNE